VTTVTLDRSSLSLAPLVIGTDPFAGSLYLPEEGLAWPVFDTRRHTLSSAYVSGRTLLAAVKEASELPITIYAKGSTGAELAAAKDALGDALAQWSYDLTLTVDSVAYAYRAEILLDIPWGPIDSGMVAAHIARASFSIPLNP
jgi:hypothetical protein